MENNQTSTGGSHKIVYYDEMLSLFDYLGHPAGGDLGGGLGGAIGGGAPPPDLGGGLGAPDASLGGAVAGGGAPTDIVTKLDVYNWDSILQNYFDKKDKESKDKKEKSIVKRLSSQFF